jgi:hypothetical protein
VADPPGIEGYVPFHYTIATHDNKTITLYFLRANIFNSIGVHATGRWILDVVLTREINDVCLMREHE